LLKANFVIYLPETFNYLKKADMAHQVKVASEKGDQVIQIDTDPDTCPKCLLGIDPRFKSGYMLITLQNE